MLSEVENKQKTISDWSVKRRYQNQNLRFISDDKDLNSDGESGNIFFNIAIKRSKSEGFISP